MGWVSWASRPHSPPCLLCSRLIGLLSPHTSSGSFILTVPSAWDNPSWLSAFLTPSVFPTSVPMSLPKGPFSHNSIWQNAHSSLPTKYPALFLRAIISTCQFICVFICIFQSHKKCKLPESWDIICLLVCFSLLFSHSSGVYNST